MADFLSRLRARLEAMQEELAPEAGFDRRAYGYDDGEGAEDAAFEEEDESPWQRETDDPAPSASPAAARARGAEGSETPRGTAVHGLGDDDPWARRPPPPQRSGRRDERTPEGAAAASGAPAPRGREVRSSLAAGGGDADPHPPEEERARAARRNRRLRSRLRQPESLRELFLLREVIDRPLALRRRPRPRRSPS